MTNTLKEWTDKLDALSNDPERIAVRKDLPVAFTVPRRPKRFSADVVVRDRSRSLLIQHIESDTLEDLKHQIGQTQFLSLDGEVEKRQKQWRIDNGIKAPKER